MTESFWKSLLKTFVGMQVRLSLRGNKELVGTLQEPGNDGCSIKTGDGRLVTVDYFDLKQVVEAR
jgi:hypothetical protein